MKVDRFDFELPEERIAQRPIEPRDAARMLVVGERLEDRIVADLPALLRPGDLMVVNDTKVLKTRFFARHPRGTIETTLIAREGRRWRGFAKPGRKLAAGDRLELAPGLDAELIEKRAGGEIVLEPTLDGAAFLEALEAHGRMPLPPYVKRAASDDPARDDRDYQTPFAENEGAVAAPTAGLHFTERLLAALNARGIERRAVTLHVGAGTFLPVRAEDTRDHVMHEERAIVSAETADAVNRAKAEGRRILAVGTTSLRTLESAADEAGRIAPMDRPTDLFLTPGAPIRIADLLLTNFHLPRSTLFMLVAAFCGLERMQAAYAHAIASGYRFYSFGDATLLHRAEPR